MSSRPALPPKGQFIQSVRDSCRDVRVAAGIPVDPEAIKRLLWSSIFQETFAALRVVHGVTIPLKFPNAVTELNFLGILALLNCGGGYRVPFHDATGRGTYDNIQALVFSLYLSSSEGSGPANMLSTKGMQTVKKETIADMLSVSLHVEKPHPTIPGLVVGELGGPLFEFIELVVQIFHETGRILEETGYPDFGTFLMEALEEARKEGAKDGLPPLAETVVQRVVTAFPAFQDMAFVGDRPVYIFKKALWLTHAINLRFSPISGPSQIPVPDSSDLPIFSDNVIPSLMVYLGAIDLGHPEVTPKLQGVFPEQSPETLESLLSETPTLPSSRKGGSEIKVKFEEGPRLTVTDAYILRAAAVDQCQRIVQTAREMEVPEEKAWISSMTTPELDGWLWAVAKDVSRYRALPRFVERPTPFY